MVRCFFLVALILIGACDPVDRRLVVINNSQDSVFYLMVEFDNLRDIYDHKLAGSGVNLTYQNYVYEIEGGGKRRHLRMGSEDTWPFYIENICENNKLHLYTFEREILRRHSWKDVTHGELIMDRKSYSLEDMERMNWQISLP